jgi:hypothetical protein
VFFNVSILHRIIRDTFPYKMAWLLLTHLQEYNPTKGGIEMKKLLVIFAAIMMLGTITSAVAGPAFFAHVQIPESESMLFFGIGLLLLAKAAEKSKD